MPETVREWKYGLLRGPYEFSAQMEADEVEFMGGDGTIFRSPTRCARVRPDGSVRFLDFPIAGYQVPDVIPDLFFVQDLEIFIEDLIKLKEFAKAHFGNDVRTRGE